MKPVEICTVTAPSLMKPLTSALAPSQHGMVDRATLVIYVILFVIIVISVNAQNCQYIGLHVHSYFEFGVGVQMSYGQ